MRILLINRWYPAGGIGNYIRILSSALTKLGHSVAIITAAQPDGRTKTSHDDRIVVYSLPYPATPYRFRRLPLMRTHYRTVETLLYARRVEQMRRKLEQNTGPFDLVEYAEINAEGLFHPKDAPPYLVTLHTPIFVLAQLIPGILGYSSYWIARWERTFIRAAQAVMAPSCDLARRVAAFCAMEMTQIKIIVNPIDLQELGPLLAKTESAPPKIVYLGYLDALKGAFLMAQAVPTIVEKCPDARITFIGHNRTLSNGQQADAHIRQIVGPALGSHIDIKGGLPHAEVLSLIRNADVCVTPSIYENCPYAALEVMACARPLVATRNSGFNEMVEDGETGLLFEPGSAKDLADKIVRLATDRAYGNLIGQQARAWVQTNYAAPLIAKKKVQVYESAIKSNAGSS